MRIGARLPMAMAMSLPALERDLRCMASFYGQRIRPGTGYTRC
jgi:hypothetical protein